MSRDRIAMKSIIHILRTTITHNAKSSSYIIQSTSYYIIIVVPIKVQPYVLIAEYLRYLTSYGPTYSLG